MDSKFTAVILTAGEGKRMAPLGSSLPKVMLPVLGKPVLDYVVSSVVDDGAGKIIIVISPKSQRYVKKYFGSSFRGVKVSYVNQERQLGPAQAIALALPKITSEYFLIYYGDSLASGNVGKNLLRTLKDNPNSDGVLAISKVDDPTRYGIVRYKDNKIVEIVEKPEKDDAPSIYATIGVFLLKTNLYREAIKGKKFEYGREFFPAQYILANGGKMSSWLFSGKRVDVGKPEDLFYASLLVAKNPIKCIAIDADNTLYQTRTIAKKSDLIAFKVVSDKTGIPVKSVYRRWESIVDKVRSSSNPLLRNRKYSYGRLCKEYKLDKNMVQKMYQIFSDYLLANLKPSPKVRAILDQLPQHKVIVSEDNGEMLVSKLKSLDLLSSFEKIITSNDTGVMKPNKSYYQDLLKDLKPEEILVVGDNYENDLRIPSELGMHILLVENQGDLQKLLDIRSK